MKDLVIIGISQTAERIARFVDLYNLYNIIGFSVNEKYLDKRSFLGRPVWPLESLNKIIDIEKTDVFVALFWNHLNADRRKLYENVFKLGFHFGNIVSPKASIRGTIGKNCWIMDYVVVQEGAVVKNDVILADNVFVGNMAIINNHCFCGAHSIVMGSAAIGEQTFVGIGATVFDYTVVGEKCLIGARTNIKRNVEPYTCCKITIDNLQKKVYGPDVIEDKLIANHFVR